jgi:hypothetical protein
MKPFIINVILIGLLFISCNDKSKESDRQVKQVLAQIKIEDYILGKSDAYIITLAEKYQVRDSVCQVLIYSFLKSKDIIFASMKLPFDSILIKLDSQPIISSELSTFDIHKLINTVSQNFNVDKKTIASILYDYMIVYRLKCLEDNLSYNENK